VGEVVSLDFARLQLVIMYFVAMSSLEGSHLTGSSFLRMLDQWKHSSTVYSSVLILIRRRHW